MDDVKRKHRKKKTTAEIKAEIVALQAELEQKQQAERIRIGEEMQKRTGLDTWEEIRKALDGAGGKGES